MIPYVTLLVVIIATTLAVTIPPGIDGGDNFNTDDHGNEMEEMKSNITALWKEVNSLKEWTHSHDGETGHRHHHHHHDDSPRSDRSHHHDDHNDTHEQVSSDHQHDHHDNHSHEMDHHDHGNHFHYDHSHETDPHHHGSDHFHDHDSHERDHHHHGSDHSHDHDSHERDHHHHEDHSHHSHSEGENTVESNQNPHSHHHPHVGHSPNHHHTSQDRKSKKHDSEENSNENSDEKHSSSFRRESISPVSSPGSRLDLTKLGSNKPREIIRVAYCDVVPNVEVPESKVTGTISIFQERLNNNGTMYFEINLQGFETGEDEASLTHGFHIHANAPSSAGHCNSIGSHFNPHKTEHGSLHSPIRHVGDLGNIVVGSDGVLSKYVLTVSPRAILGASTLISKAIAIHEGADDLGRGGTPGSRSGGNAGRFLACCAIYGDISGTIRFNG